jgi:hypothetical protein
MRVEKLPFTIYNIVGYFLPGAVLLASIVFALFPDLLVGLYYVRDGLKVSTYAWILISILSIVASYALGYCIAIFSSEGIEEVFIDAFGYPSKFLLGKHCSLETECTGNSSEDNASFLRKIFALHYVLNEQPPACNWLIKVSHEKARSWFGSIFVKSIDDNVINQLDKKFVERFCMSRKEISGSGWFSLVENYVMNNNESAFMRMYNYVTMYGFCRNLSAALYWSAIVLFLGVTISFFSSLLNLRWFSLSWDVAIRVYLVILTMILLSGVMAANFAKFYRRYSHEAILAFVTMKDECKENRKPAEAK